MFRHCQIPSLVKIGLKWDVHIERLYLYEFHIVVKLLLLDVLFIFSTQFYVYSNFILSLAGSSISTLTDELF